MIQNIKGKDASNYKAVFFDLDGTITDSGSGCLNGVKYMFEKIGFGESDESKINAFVGPAVKPHLIEEYKFSEDEAAAAYVFYREYYDNKGIYENYLYDGIYDLIMNIKNTDKTIYLATLKPQDQAELILEHFELSCLFSGVFGARHDLGIYHKNKVLKHAADIVGDVSDAVMVGDRSYDIIAGQHVGLDTVGVLYGYGSKKELLDAGCDYLADSINDLYALLGRKDK